MVPRTASPKRIACSTATRLRTGSTPGSAISTAEACALGGAPNAVGAPEKILLRVRSCACVSMPTTISQLTRSPRAQVQQLAVAAAVDEQRLEMRLGAAVRRAILGAQSDKLARVAQRQAAPVGHEAQAAA